MTPCDLSRVISQCGHFNLPGPADPGRERQALRKVFLC